MYSDYREMRCDAVNLMEIYSTYRSFSPDTQSFHSSPIHAHMSWHVSVKLVGPARVYLTAFEVVVALHLIPLNRDRTG